MTDIQSIYLSLLRQALCLVTTDTLNVNLSMLTAADFDSLVHLNQIQGTAPLIFNELLKTNSSHIDEVLVMRLRAACMQNMLHQQHLMEIMRQTFTALSQDGVQATLLKGFGLAQLYSLPYLRTWGDLDVYVGPEQYHQACAVLRSQFPSAKHPPMEYEEFKHYNFDFPDGYNIETHRVSMVFGSPSENRIWQQLEHDGCLVHAESITVDGFNVMIPEPQFNMLFVFAHAWEHFVDSGMPIKQLCDLALLAHNNYTRMGSGQNQYRLYQDYLHTNLSRLHLLHPWKIVGYIIVNYLHLPQGEWPEYDGSWLVQRYANRFLQRVMLEGGYRITQPQRKVIHNSLCRKLYTFYRRIQESLIIFPVAPTYALRMIGNALMKGLRRIGKSQTIEWGIMVEN